MVDKKKILEERRLKIERGLPFLYAHKGKFYNWQLDFFKSRNKNNFLVAANQIGKSTTLLRKEIMIATHPEGIPKFGIPSWKEQFPNLDDNEGLLIWYLYPDSKTTEIEFENKWKKYLPKDEFKDSKKFGWKLIKKASSPFCIEFNTGARIYFRYYSQDKGNIQSVSVHIINSDEELYPSSLYDELIARTFATQGYFNMVFTATHGQTDWERVMAIGSSRETFKDAYKKKVTVYECMKYSDGTPSMWSIERITENRNKCKTENEYKRRMLGEFVLDVGLVYESFSALDNVIDTKEIPKNWIRYAGIDIGSGGSKNHPSAIAFVAVRPDFKLAYLYKFWRGDNDITTAGDVVDKFEMLRDDEFVPYIYYDWHSRDFFNIAISKGVPVRPAEKSHDIGESLLNTLFKNKMLFIFDNPETQKLVEELKSLKVETPKNKAKDDGIDALRYSISKITFDFSSIEKKKVIKVNKEIRDKNIRKEEKIDDLEEWGQYYDVF